MVSSLVIPRCKTVLVSCNRVGVDFIYPITIGAGQDRPIIHCQIICIGRNIRFIQCVLAPFTICQNPSHLSNLLICRIYAVLQPNYNHILTIFVVSSDSNVHDIFNSEVQEILHDRYILTPCVDELFDSDIRFLIIFGQCPSSSLYLIDRLLATYLPRISVSMFTISPFFLNPRVVAPRV